jgi:hypothetical protein
MDPNSLQHLPGMAYVQKLQTEVPFSQYDNLTPDEPIRAWQFAKHVLNVAANIVTSRFFKHTLSRQASNTLRGHGQSAPALE